MLDLKVRAPFALTPLAACVALTMQVGFYHLCPSPSTPQTHLTSALHGDSMLIWIYYYMCVFLDILHVGTIGTFNSIHNQLQSPFIILCHSRSISCARTLEPTNQCQETEHVASPRSEYQSAFNAKHLSGALLSIASYCNSVVDGGRSQKKW